MQNLNVLVKLRKTQLIEKLSKAKLMGRNDLKEFMVYELVVLQGALNDLIQSSNNKFCIESEKIMSALSNVVVDGVSEQHDECAIDKAA
ncbi:hypothetical protein [Ehrlichia canis]|uniref:hypothetical protein n=2 Tax=Ehrlichia canis TaxID=944 RepID=UPI0012DB7AFE|nr:hypothetical protein [Ehrlichia canis]